MTGRQGLSKVTRPSFLLLVISPCISHSHSTRSQNEQSQDFRPMPIGALIRLALPWTTPYPTRFLVGSGFRRLMPFFFYLSLPRDAQTDTA